MVLVDECHSEVGKVARKILDAHYHNGAAYIGFTATPLELADLYDHLIVGGTTNSLRECGALVLARHFGCDEPDLKHIGRVRLGQDLTEKQNVKAIMVPGIFGRVFEWFEKLNPERRPTILFAPGVAESLWFAKEFYSRGITAAHIDGDNVWLNGEERRASRQARQDILDGSRDGTIKVLCNRFVLREGIDAPWLAHGIFATVFGSLQSYLQSGGRLLRAHPGLDGVTIQDHGGNWWRHGSLNDDRQWRLDLTSGMVATLREEAMRNGTSQPVRCPKCAAILRRPHCPACGWEPQGKFRVRPVIMADGTLQEMHGDPYLPRRTEQRPDTAKLWANSYYRAKKSRNHMTFNQALGLFFRENGYCPERNLPLMPTNQLDWHRPVVDVPMDRLIPRPRSGTAAG